MIETCQLPSLVGVGLRAQHLQEVEENRFNKTWFEVHSENYFNPHSVAFQSLCNIRENVPISLHGVGLSLGSHDNLDMMQHLDKLKKLVERIEPCFISEHLAWNAIKGNHMPDLFPIPYTPEYFDIIKSNINKVQDFLKREILIENPSSYIEYEVSVEHEVDFLVRLAEKTGARILLDINNVYVSSYNHGWDVEEYLRAIPVSFVSEFHLAGHSEYILKSGKKLLIDTHDKKIADEVWALYKSAIVQFGQIPTLIEWDAQLPSFNVLMEEAQQANHVLLSTIENKGEKYA